ncbi:Zinc/iron permease [Obelidium mucronatum]|nr:Zinc/iron permease [Obelidium mucronatum]
MDSECALQELSSYDLKFHIAGIFIVLVVSCLGICSTMALGVHGTSPTMTSAMHVFKFFGIGIIAATAWLHLLPDAFSQFGSPCLPSGWQHFGSAFVGLFGMIAAFLVQFIELAVVDYKRKAQAKLEQTQDKVSDSKSAQFGALVCDNPDKSESNMTIPIAHGHNGHHPQERNSELGIILLECGIVFHSLIIGITLGVTPDDTFTTIMIAICFHQMFEGMALGILIGNLNISIFAKRIMCLMYPLTTPLGITIGVGVRNFYNANDGGFVVAQGICDSLSAGILIYNTYTELMNGEVNHSGHFINFSPVFKGCCFLAMYLGAATMAVIALWA